MVWAEREPLERLVGNVGFARLDHYRRQGATHSSNTSGRVIDACDEEAATCLPCQVFSNSLGCHNYQLFATLDICPRTCPSQDATLGTYLGALPSLREYLIWFRSCSCPSARFACAFSCALGWCTILGSLCVVSGQELLGLSVIANTVICMLSGTSNTWY